MFMLQVWIWVIPVLNLLSFIILICHLSLFGEAVRNAFSERALKDLGFAVRNLTSNFQPISRAPNVADSGGHRILVLLLNAAVGNKGSLTVMRKTVTVMRNYVHTY